MAKLPSLRVFEMTLEKLKSCRNRPWHQGIWVNVTQKTFLPWAGFQDSVPSVLSSLMFLQTEGDAPEKEQSLTLSSLVPPITVPADIYTVFNIYLFI